MEFLNEQMDPAEVLALEVRQYVGEDRQTLVPRLIGLSAAAEGRKGRGSAQGPRWTEERFLAQLADSGGQESVAVARRLLEWARSRRLRLWWGRGRQDGSFYPMFDHGGHGHPTFAVRTSGTVRPQFSFMANHPVFDDPGRREELLGRLNEIPGLELTKDSLQGIPRIPLETPKSAGALKTFLGVWGWYLEEIRSAADALGNGGGTHA